MKSSRNRWFADSLLEGTGFEPSVPPKKRRPSREAPRPTIVVTHDDLCLITPSSLSVRHLLSATAETENTKAEACALTHSSLATASSSTRKSGPADTAGTMLTLLTDWGPRSPASTSMFFLNASASAT